MSQLQRGYLYGLAAYLTWGFFPLYFHQLAAAGPVEILAHRVVWAVVFVAAALAVMRNWSFVARLVRRPRTLAAIGAAAVLIGANWGVYIYGVVTERVVETALGYFINPLVVILLGVVVLRERLRAAQWVALGIGAVAVAVLAVGYGRLPYLALFLAFSFSGYGLIKKRLGLPAAEGLFVESAVLAAPALGYLMWLSWRSEATFTGVSVAHTALLVVAGPATAIPLLLFAAAANRIPLTGLGILQYVTPILQFIIGVVVLREPMPPARLAGFALVWIALLIFTVDGLLRRRRPVEPHPPAGRPAGSLESPPLVAAPRPAAHR